MGGWDRGLPFPAPFCCGRSSGRARCWDEPSHSPRPGRQPGGPEEPATARLTARRAASRGRSQEPQPGKSPSERGSAGCACGRTGGDWGRSGLVGSSPIFNQKSKRALGGSGRGRAGGTCVPGRARRVTLEGGSIAPPGGIEARMVPGAQPVGRCLASGLAEVGRWNRQNPDQDTARQGHVRCPRPWADGGGLAWDAQSPRHKPVAQASAQTPASWVQIPARPLVEGDPEGH